MPVIRRTDHDRIDVWTGENFTMVAVLAGIGAVLCLGFLTVRFVDVTDGDQIVAPGPVKEAKQVPTALASSNGPETNAIVCADNAAVGHGARRKCGGCTDKGAAI